MPSTRRASGANRPPKWSPPGSGAYSSMEICEIGSPLPSAGDRRRVDLAVIPSEDGSFVLEPSEDDLLAARGARRLHAEATVDRRETRNEIGQLHPKPPPGRYQSRRDKSSRISVARDWPRAYAGAKAKKAGALGGP